MEINTEGNLAACQLGSVRQFVQTEEAQVAAEDQVTGDLTGHTYATGISPTPLLHVHTRGNKLAFSFLIV